MLFVHIDFLTLKIEKYLIYIIKNINLVNPKIMFNNFYNFNLRVNYKIY